MAFSKSESYFRLHDLLSALFFQKLAQEKIDLKTLSEFVALRCELYTFFDDDLGTIKIQKALRGWFLPEISCFKVIDLIEDHVKSKQLELMKARLNRSVFVFLCCVRHVHKDMRRLLFCYAQDANQQFIEERMRDLHQFASRHCKRKVWRQAN